MENRGSASDHARTVRVQFMTMADNWQSGAFHRFAPHVLQAQVKGGFQHLSFQEYSPQFPHEIYTLG